MLIESEDKIMSDMVDIKVITDETAVDPRVEIYTQSDSKLVDNIIYAIENVTRTNYPPIPAYDKGVLKIISQRDIYRVRTEGREILLDTADMSYAIKGTLSKLEDILDSERFFRISQSELINLYKVESFDFNITGTVGVLFDNGVRSYVARRCVKPLREKLKNTYDNKRRDTDESEK